MEEVTKTAKKYTRAKQELVSILVHAQRALQVRFGRLDKTYKADIKRTALSIVTPEKRLLVLKALWQIEAERKYGRAPPTAMEIEQQTFLEDLLQT